MYLFLRSATAVPERLLDAAAFAVEIAATASSLSGREISAWQVEFGAPMSNFVWSSTAESHADLRELGDKLLTETRYVESVAAAGDLFAGAGEDVLSDILAMAGDGGQGREYASVVMAQCTVGRIVEAMGWGVEMMEHAARVTGLDGLFTRSMYGPFASVAWISLADSAEEVDHATAALAADPDYLTMIDDSAGLFVPGSGTSRLSRRIG